MSENKEIITNLKSILDVLQNIGNKWESDIILNTSDNKITVYFDEPLQIHENAQIALKTLSTYYSIPNIDKRNNNFRYKKLSDSSWVDINLEEGSYEIADIGENIQDIMNINERSNVFDSLPKAVIIKADTSIMKCILEIPAGYTVDFSTPNSIGKILGFSSTILKPGRYTSDKVVDINPVSSILVHCDLVSGSTINGSPSRCIYSFSPKVPPGYKIIQEATHPVFYSILKRPSIDKLHVWITDENLNPINLRGETLTIVLSLRT